MPDFLINVSGAGDNTIIPAPVLQSGLPNPRGFIRVHHWHLTSDRPTSCKFYAGASASGNLKDGTYSTQVSGGGICTPDYSNGIFDCANGSALILNLSAAANVIGSVQASVFGQGGIG